MTPEQQEAVNAAKKRLAIKNAQLRGGADVKPMPPGGAMSRYMEPALTMLSGAGAEIAGGLTGLATQRITGDLGAANYVQDAVRDKLTYQPRTQAGQQGLMDLSYAVEPITRAHENLGNRLGDKAFDLTGSPGVAAAFKTLPDGILTIGGMMNAPTATATGRGLLATGRQMIPQAQQKRQAALNIQQGVPDVDTARYTLIPEPESELGQAFQLGGPKVKGDPFASAALKQGYDESVLAAIKMASRADKDRMLEMLDILEKGKRNKRYQGEFRPTDVAGDALESSVKAIVQARKNAGSQIDSIAKEQLKGQPVDFNPSVSEFAKGLQDMGIEIKVNRQTGKVELDFSDSDIEGMQGFQNSINRLWTRMRDTRSPDAYDVHRLKRYIDQNVDYGTSTAEGMSAKIEILMKDLRRNMDSALDGLFPDYDEVNTVYSETTQAIKDLQKGVGPSINLSSPNADKALGTSLRKLMSNYSSRTNLMDAIKVVDDAATKHGGFGQSLLPGATTGKTDLYNLTLFANELDRMFGTPATNSFMGQTEQAATRAASTLLNTTTPQGQIYEAAGLLDKGLHKMRGINEANAIKAMRELLEVR